jgi:septum formation topological specificity factor MinE
MLEVVQHELITVIAKYTDSTWVPESMIKMHLLDRFNAVVGAELSA